LKKRTDRSNGLLTTGIVSALILAGCASNGDNRNEIAPTPTVAPTRMQVDPTQQQSLPNQAAPAVELQSTAPEQYTVQKGDTLWDISGRFLMQPWYWPEIWYVNPKISNPHLIYPGDVISLYYVDGKPRLSVNRHMAGVGQRGLHKLSPSVHTSDLEDKDVGVPISAISPFLIRPQIVAEEELKQAAHIVDSQENHLIYGSGDKVYARGLSDPMIGARYSTFRAGGPLLDPDTGETIAFEATYTSDAEVIRTEGELATIQLRDSVREVLRGDRLLPLEMGPKEYYFVPHAPAPGTKGRIISFYEALSQVAQYQVVVVNLGKRNGIEPGHVLAINQAGRSIVDRDHRKDQNKEVTLPTERAGTMMIFRSFDKVSYGLIMESERSMRIGDYVAAP